jgi:hypothetical protein
MSKPLLIIVAVVVVAIIGVVVVLATTSLPAPKAPFEKTLPSDRFPG